MWFLIKEGLNGLRKARIPVILSILAITVLLFFNGIFFLTILKINDLSNRFKSGFTIEFMVNPTAENKIKDLAGTIAKEHIVREVTIISPDSSLAEVSKTFGLNLRGIIRNNPLPVVIDAHIFPEYVQSEFINKMVERFKKDSRFMSIRYPENYLALLEKYGMGLLLIVMTLGLVFFFLSILMVTYTLKITMQIKKDLIFITRLMGGTSFHIRFPFLIEAFVEGFLAAMISSALVMLFQNLMRQFGFETTFINENLIIFMISSGLFISVVGTQIALKRYLFANEEHL